MNLGEFVDALHRARTFEQAADCLLEHALEAAKQGFPADVTVLRGMVHLRPDDAYRGVALRAVAGSGPGEVAVMPSTTAWRWVNLARGPVLLDVSRGQAVDANGQPLDLTGARPPDFRSRGAVMMRQASHIVACPLRRAGGRLDGFLSVEIATELGLDGGSPVAGELQLLADVAAPFVGELPRAAHEELRGEPGLPVIGATMRASIEDLRLFAGTDCTILVRGETGVGKTRLAKWCWRQSARRDRPFVSVNLLSTPETLREGLLFGSLEGSYSGATEDRQGLVEQAAGGTLFIDEIDTLPPRGQAMLLSLLDDGEYRVIGDATQRQADIRFIVGSNADLEQAIEQGMFREDLYYRIQEFPIRLPPLRERRDEIVAWADYLLAELNQPRGSDPPRLEAAAGSLLEGQPWPGNLRGLHAVIKLAYGFAARDAGPAPAQVVVRAAHVERALARIAPQSSDALWRALERAAAAFVTQAFAAERELTLEQAGAFSGFVLREAVARVGEKQAFERLGRARSLESSNHRKVLRREHDRVAALARALGRRTDGE